MNFNQRVYEAVRGIPDGKVMTYGQIASELGNPRASRAVGWALRALTIEEEDVPWWRVVNKQGYLSINHGMQGYEKMTQADLLRDEGVEVSDEYIVDMGEYLVKDLP